MFDSSNTFSYGLRNLQEIANRASYLFLLVLGFCIPLTITGISIALVLTLVFTILSSQIKTKWQNLVGNPVLWAALGLFALLLISISYSSAAWQDKIDVLGKYQKLLYLIFLIPLFNEYRWQKAGIWLATLG
jgi:putative effector of murein hydrolase